MNLIWNDNACRIACASLMAMILAGCSGIPRYEDPFPPNMRVRTELDSGTIFSNTVAGFDVYRVRDDCNFEYRGRVSLDKASTDVGVPVDETVYLDFIFTTRRGEVRHGTLLTPRPEHDYEALATYSKGMYDVVIRETYRGNTSPRLLEKRLGSGCKKQAPDPVRRKTAREQHHMIRHALNG